MLVALRDAATIINNLQLELVTAIVQIHIDVAGFGMLADIVAGFLRNAKQDGGRGGRNGDVFDVTVEFKRNAGLLLECLRQPFKRGNQPGFQNAGPQIDGDSMNGFETAINQRIKISGSFGNVGIVYRQAFPELPHHHLDGAEGAS